VRSQQSAVLSDDEINQQPWNVWLPATIEDIHEEKSADPRSDGKPRVFLDIRCESLTTPLIRRQVVESIRPALQSKLRDLRYDLQDGVLLCRILECLSGRKISASPFTVMRASSTNKVEHISSTACAPSMESHPIPVSVFDPAENDAQRRHNLNQFLNCFVKFGHSCSVIGRRRIVDDILNPFEPLLQSKVDVALGLLWALILTFRVKTASMYRNITETRASQASQSQKIEGVRGLDGLLQWCQEKLGRVEAVSTYGWTAGRDVGSSNAMVNLQRYQIDSLIGDKIVNISSQSKSNAKGKKGSRGGSKGAERPDEKEDLFRPPADAGIADPSEGGVLLRRLPADLNVAVRHQCLVIEVTMGRVASY